MGLKDYASLTRAEREDLVLTRLKSNRIWDVLNQEEKEFSVDYVDRLKSTDRGLCHE